MNKVETLRAAVGRHNFRALVFDCDGTLAYTAPCHHASLAGALRPFGAELPLGWYRARLGLSRDALLAELPLLPGCVLDPATIARDAERLFAEELHRVREIAAVAAIAREHAGSVPMAVASGGQRAQVEATLRQIGLLELFDTVVAIEDVSAGKPSPELFLLAANRLVTAPAECLVFEDTDEGLAAAAACGMPAIDVRGLDDAWPTWLALA